MDDMASPASPQALKAVELQSVHVLGELDDDKSGTLILAKAPMGVDWGPLWGEPWRRKGMAPLVASMT